MGFCKFSKFHFMFSIIFYFVISGVENAQILNDQASLLSFMSGISYDPKHALESWNSSSVHACNWFGVTCNINRDRVTQLDLSGKSLRGIISPAISNLSSLMILDLSDNFFEGHIPKELGFLLWLKQLSLSSNHLEGKIPAELGFLQGLVYLNLGSNRLTGEIPMPLFCNGSSSLAYIDLSNNSIKGEIPLKKQCALKNLRFLLLWSNQLVGEVPIALSNSSKLEWLDLESNSLREELPHEIVNRMPMLQFLYLSYNKFSSHNGNTNLKPFFSSLLNSSKLQELELAGNNLGGEIPSIIGDLSTSLVQIHLDENLIYGSIPPQISNLVNLTLLNLSCNALNGSIPLELCQMGKLERLYLSNNSLSGEIPSSFGHVPHLGLLDLSKNRLYGSIPDSFANLSQLRRLLLYDNQLSGTIPPSLGKCNNLEILDLSRNRISGLIPIEVARLSSLKLYLNLSSNHLDGNIPLELSKMDMVLAIDLSSNNLTGTIPSQLGSCIALEYLNLSSNSLEGRLPLSIGRLPYLNELDVSINKLFGEVPQTLQASSALKHLNLSFNTFSGNISNTGSFSSMSIDSFLGNQGLCGSIRGMPSCQKKHTNYRTVILPTVIVSLFVSLILCAILYPRVFLKSKFKKKMSIFDEHKFEDQEEETQEQNDSKYPKITHQQLIEATGGFSNSSLIGSGSFGQVYKGVLQDNTRIAVKVINDLSRTANSSSFKRECQVLKRTRHKNLIRIITICSRPGFKAIVLPLMANGSLENHLYPSHGLNLGLDLVQLISICGDVAEGLAYLHHYSHVRVVHCDLKPSNILLDEDMRALVTDFGIAKLVKSGHGDHGDDDDDDKFYGQDCSISFSSSSDGLLCGSVGYIAPEYGMGQQASTQGDVYSFGVLLLEIVTGKRPTDDTFAGGSSSLHEWVKSRFPYNNKLLPIVEAAVERYAPQTSLAQDNKKIWQDVIMEMIELGLICTQYNPSTRPTMLDVAHEMGRLKHYISSVPLNSARIFDEDDEYSIKVGSF